MKTFVMVVISGIWLWTPTVAISEDYLSAAEMACELNPDCKPGRMRSFRSRGLSVQEEQGAPAPRTLNLFVNFAFDSDELDQDSKITLDRLAAALRTKELASYSFLIKGHADAKGGEEYNEALSKRRAESVRKYLLSQGAGSESSLRATGFGESRLLLPDAPTDGANRRVEVTNDGPVGDAK